MPAHALRVPALAGVAALVTLAAASSAQAATQSFNNPGQYRFVVPANVTSLQIQAQGGGGGNALDVNGNVLQQGGDGRSVSATLQVSPGETLWVEVGANGSSGVNLRGGGGGGATDIRTCAVGAVGCPGGSSLQTRLLIAGGAGGAGGSAAGGTGGDADQVGQDGTSSFGSGGDTGTTNDGGQGGGGTNNPGNNGTLGAGGAGGAASGAGQGGNGGANGGAPGGGTDGTLTGGGGAGGGYYGGGGGAGSDPFDAGGGGGGGGGASYVIPSATSVQMSWSSANPSVTLTWTPTPTPPPPPPAPPTVQGVSPNSGPVAGGQVVKITGTFFGSARQVYFGNSAAPRFQVLGFNTISVVAPPSSATGTFNVRVLGAFSVLSAVNPADVYTYGANPTPPPTPPTPPPTPPAPPTTTCVVPNVHHRTLSAARRRMAQSRCEVGSVRGPRRRHGRVVLVSRQSIPPGTRLLPGDRVNLRLRAYRAGRR